MGTFQSKHKYDVATGESSIKKNIQSDRKKDHVTRISQYNDALKLSTQQPSDEERINENFKVVTGWSHFSEKHEDDDRKTLEHVDEFQEQPNSEENEPQTLNITVENVVISESDKPIEESLVEIILETDQVPEAARNMDVHEEPHLTDEVTQPDLNTSNAAIKERDLEIPNTELADDSCINQVFIDEERKVVFGTDEEHKASDLTGDVTEQEAITVLNDVIEEACPIIASNVQDHLEEVCVVNNVGDAEAPQEFPNKNEEIHEVLVPEPTEDISTTPVNRDLKIEEVPNVLALHEITIVSESEKGNEIVHIQEERKMSHIYLDSVNNDEINYTLDKLQVMEEQIKSNKARILNIKEIN